MVQTIQAQNISLYDLKTKFNLHLAEDDLFFSEWMDDLPLLTDAEKQSLDRVKSNYLNLTQRRSMIESLVQMVVLSPLLDLAGFYQPPFEIEAETPVQISAENEAGEIVQGRIDFLVLRHQLWILVVESKRNSFSVEPAIPQALAYMLANPHPEKPTFGLVTNGFNFIFIKLVKQGTPQYALSNQFSLINRGNDLHNVLRILKRLVQLLG
ncbi:MAG: restriction endonuclease subunit R [Chroococcidiopsidaceae cyanobacterium CP_BM_ER_R8_30]|nr:restriction endonuclease subunit R [Chroococcidiopsidaceae cyanobacterium CP_BM_ER_R8_30]